MTYLLLIVGFVLIVKGAHLLVEGASSVARRLNVSDLAIGLTVVAFGTSTPELFVTLIAALRGNPDIAIGNVVGSNIANIFLIVGVSSVIYPLAVSEGTVWKGIPFGFLASVLLGIAANDMLIDYQPKNIFSRSDGLILLSFFLVFIYYSVSTAQKVEGMESLTSGKAYGMVKSVLLVISGFAALTIGGKWIVDGAVHIALRYGMSQTLVGLTIVAVGTALPELATSTVAAWKHNVEIAVGNVVGSNIFNLFFVLGFTSLFKPLPFKPENNIDIGVMIVANTFLFVSMFLGKKHTVDRWVGAVFIFIYIGYVISSILLKYKL